MIRLLQKSEVIQAKSKERQQEIDEGAKLARRIDSLRELQAIEEKNLEQFRIATVTQINIEIVELQKKKEQLEYEVAQLGKRQVELSS